MTNYTDLIERLRDPDIGSNAVSDITNYKVTLYDWKVLNDAADAIEALVKERDELIAEAAALRKAAGTGTPIPVVSTASDDGFTQAVADACQEAEKKAIALQKELDAAWATNRAIENGRQEHMRRMDIAEAELVALRKQIDELQPVGWKHTNNNILKCQINDMAPGYYGSNWEHTPLFSLEGIKK